MYDVYSELTKINFTKEDFKQTMSSLTDQIWQAMARVPQDFTAEETADFTAKIEQIKKEYLVGILDKYEELLTLMTRLNRDIYTEEEAGIMLKIATDYPWIRNKQKAASEEHQRLIRQVIDPVGQTIVERLNNE